MSVTGIGSNYSYIYHSQTGKLSTKNGAKDAFVDYFNGEPQGKLPDTINGFDANKKSDIEKMIMLFNSGMTKNVFDESNGTEFEISGEVLDAVTSEYSINGEKVFTAHHAVAYTYDEVKAFGNTKPDSMSNIIPEYIYNAAVKRYEEMLYQPLNMWKK